MAEKFGLVEAICGTVLVKKIERQKALKFLMQNSFKKRMLFIYREQSREKKVSLSACANRSCLSNTFWWFSVLSLSFSRKASLLLYCPSICRRVLGKKLHPASFSFFYTLDSIVIGYAELFPIWYRFGGHQMALLQSTTFHNNSITNPQDKSLVLITTAVQSTQ